MTYDAAFYKAESDVALVAAEIVLPEVLERTKAKSVIDVGCGTGAWLSVAKAHGCCVLGVDGYAPDETLMISRDEFVRYQLERGGYPCDGYDLALCLEVGEHLNALTAHHLVQWLCEAKFVLWSAAIPNQGGVGHVNEQWPSWWERLFAEHGYRGTGQLRKQHWDDERIVDFYRQNLILWAKPEDLVEAGFEPQVLLDLVHPDLAAAKGWT